MSDEFKHIDKLFRSRFENLEIEPPRHVWENIKSGIKPGNPPGGSSGSWGGIAGFTALLILLGVLLVYLFMDVLTVRSASPAKQTLTPQEQETVDNTQTEKILSITRGTGQAGNTTKQTQQFSFTNKRNKTVLFDPAADQPVSSSAIAKSSLLARKDTPEPLANDGGLDEKPVQSVSLPVPVAKQVAKLNSCREKETIGLQHAMYDDWTPEVRSDYGRPANLLFGVYFSPEWMNYPMDDIQNYGLGVEILGTRMKENFILQAGIGLSRYSDNGNYRIDYNKYLGSYEDVYDVQFDTSSGTPVPIYFTETVDVYDTINYIRITPTKRYFTYLQFPLMMGYGETYRRLGWFIKTGPSLGVKIHENIPDAPPAGDNYKILNVENDLPDRIDVVWQLHFSVGITYKLGNRVSLSVEPVFKYSINPAYDQGTVDSKHPYGLGLRSGLLFDF